MAEGMPATAPVGQAEPDAPTPELQRTLFPAFAKGPTLKRSLAAGLNGNPPPPAEHRQPSRRVTPAAPEPEPQTETALPREALDLSRVTLTDPVVRMIELKPEFVRNGRIVIDLGVDCTASREAANIETITSLDIALRKLQQQLKQKIPGGLQIDLRVHSFRGYQNQQPRCDTVPLSGLAAYLDRLGYATGPTKWLPVLKQIDGDARKHPPVAVIFAGDGMEDATRWLQEMNEEQDRSYQEYIDTHGYKPREKKEKFHAFDAVGKTDKALAARVAQTPFFFLSSHDARVHSDVTGEHIELFEDAAAQSAQTHGAGEFIEQFRSTGSDFDRMAESMVRHATRAAFTTPALGFADDPRNQPGRGGGGNSRWP